MIMRTALVKQNTSLPQIAVRYEAAKTALQRCISIDECKETMDQATAMKVYAQQVKDESLIHMASRIRIRAMRKMGEMLQTVHNKAQFARDVGMSMTTLQQCQQLFRVDVDIFESMVECDPPRRVDHIANLGIMNPEPEYRRETVRPSYHTPSVDKEVVGLTDEQIDRFFAGVQRAIAIKTKKIKIGAPLHFDQWKFVKLTDIDMNGGR